MNVPTRTVRCYHCRTDVEVGRAARSATCPRCYKGLILDDLLVQEGSYAGKLTTCGKITVDRKARAITRVVEASAGLEVVGQLEAKVTSHGPVFVGKGARMTGECQASSFIAEPGAVIEGILRIGPPVASTAQG